MKTKDNKNKVAVFLPKLLSAQYIIQFHQRYGALPHLNWILSFVRESILIIVNTGVNTSNNRHRSPNKKFKFGEKMN